MHLEQVGADKSGWRYIAGLGLDVDGRQGVAGRRWPARAHLEIERTPERAS